MSDRKTNRGQIIDFDKFMSSRKDVVAAGNMGVNANGDVLGSRGTIIQKNEDRVLAYYKDNPRSSTQTQSIKTPVRESGLAPDILRAPATSKTFKEEDRVKAVKKKRATTSTPAAYEEKMDDDGNIEVIKYSDQGENDELDGN